MAEDSSKTFDRALLIMALFAALTAVLAGIAAFRGGGASEEAADGEGGPVTASIELAEWSITGDLEIPAGEVTVDVTNAGTMTHNLVFENDGPVPPISIPETLPPSKPVRWSRAPTSSSVPSPATALRAWRPGWS